MIKKAFLTIFNNYAAIGAGVYGRYLMPLIFGLPFILILAGLSFQMLSINLDILFYSFNALKAVVLYLLVLSGLMLSWRYKSKKEGFRSLIIFPCSTIWLRVMLKRRSIDIPISDNCIEIHVNTSESYKSMKEYDAALDTEVKRLKKYLDRGKFGDKVTVVFNSFNRQLMDKLEKEFGSNSKRFSKTALPNWMSKMYTPRKFKKVQRKMFGEVKSTRIIHYPKSWELLIYNHELKGGTAV